MRSGLLAVLGATLAVGVAALPLYASETAPSGAGDTPSAEAQGVEEISPEVEVEGPVLEASAPAEPATAAEVEAEIATPAAAAALDDSMELAAEAAPDDSMQPAVEAVLDDSTELAAEAVDDDSVELAPEAAGEGAEVEAVAPSVPATEADPSESDNGAPTDVAQDGVDSDPAALADLAPQDPAPAVPMTLGEIGYDEQGRAGRIHLVVRGDTLWDISDGYLGTPWVWPSVWTDNREIENPHLIVPGDRIWISAHEMRRVTLVEAERLLAGEPAGDEPPAAAGSTEDEGEDELATAPADPASIRVSSNETSGLITAQQLESAASVVDAVSDRVMLSQGDQVYIGLGEADASVGDQFTVFRTREKVFDPDTNRLLGYHVDFLGWVEVDEVKPETSLTSIRMSASEIEIGDRVIPREPPLLDIEVGPGPEGVDGKISFLPSSRVMMGTIDYVYLNRGELHGLEVGSPLEVYRSGWVANEPARRTQVEVPDRAVADLLVVRTQDETAVAVVTHTETEIELGDHFRGAME
jgi:nucleoid-associated protein YgaU